MVNKKPDNPDGTGQTARSDNGSMPQAPGQSMQLSAKDHGVLERAIRGTVSNMVGASHPELAAERRSGFDFPERDLMLHPENHPLARQLPGTERTIVLRDRLLSSLIDPDPRHHREFVRELLADPIPLRTLAVNLFAPVAARLGDLWCTDEVDFMQVAVASTRLSMIVHHVSHVGHSMPTAQTAQRRILLARTRGAMHTIGVSIVTSCFRDMGWAVDGGSDLEIDDSLYIQLASKPYNVLGISVGRIDDVPECSEAIRRVQTNPRTNRMKVAIGGPAVIASPNSFMSIGADFVTRTPLDVMQLAANL